MTTLLEKYIAKVGEMRKNYRCAACDGAKCQHTMCCNALSDIQSLLPELIKEVRKDGYFEALDDTREWITRSGGIPEGYITDVLDNLRKNLI